MSEADYGASHFRLLKRAGGSISEEDGATEAEVPGGPRNACT